MTTSNAIRGRRPIINLRAKRLVANGAATTLSLRAEHEYSYVTTTAASLTVTMPGTATGACVDGMVCSVCFDSAIGTLAWAAGSGGATIVGAPSAAVANTVYRFVYHHATTSWYPF